MQTAYRSNTFILKIVQAAKKLAEEKGFSNSCSDEVGRLLSVLVGQIRDGKILEIGTGYGVGSSWILSAIAPTTEFISVDNCKEKMDVVMNTLFHNQVKLYVGDWKEVISEGPFQFIFADAATAKTFEGEILLQALDQGGLLLMDDFTPEEHFPDEWKGKPDTVREFWLNHEELVATEIYLTPKTSAILATKRT
ncbi:O-methyltransferase [Bacillus pinisoli]|uniref:O-methyltransferase n=1 Tax=Bacillus pinisoli TaxID=2901866 RepID=UPI001FF3897C